MTAPAEVIMGCPCQLATLSPLVFRSGCSASHIFFFCTCMKPASVYELSFKLVRYACVCGTAATTASMQTCDGSNRGQRDQCEKVGW